MEKIFVLTAKSSQSRSRMNTAPLTTPNQNTYAGVSSVTPPGNKKYIIQVFMTATRVPRRPAIMLLMVWPDVLPRLYTKKMTTPLVYMPLFITKSNTFRVPAGIMKGRPVITMNKAARAASSASIAKPGLWSLRKNLPIAARQAPLSSSLPYPSSRMGFGSSGPASASRVLTLLAVAAAFSSEPSNMVATGGPELGGLVGKGGWRLIGCEP
mmetsp:Transcript_35006/g.89939  ORF Transcript_35006/g.89939 Transcript_35006/m.89939 type:complete len:211 (+) Transcript_35006:1979-2611(+)